MFFAFEKCGLQQHGGAVVNTVWSIRLIDQFGLMFSPVPCEFHLRGCSDFLTLTSA